MALSQTDVIRAGAFLARTVYGGTYIAAPYRGVLQGADDPLGYDDDYRGYIESQSLPGGSWRVLDAGDLGPGFFAGEGGGRFTEGGLFVSASDDGNGGEVLIVEGTMGGERTLFIVFRGSDGGDAALEGQTFTKEGMAYYYLLLRPAILAAAAYAEANGIANVVVAGHSLGGSMVDVFALADADLFAGKSLFLVSLGSAGVVPDLSDYQRILGLDLSRSTLDGDGHIVTLGLPDAVTAYYGINHSEDRVYHSIPADAEGLLPNLVLYRNKHFGDAIGIALPNMDNTDALYSGSGIDAAFPHGFGAEHNSALYWSNIDAITRDPLAGNWADQRLILGINAYESETRDYDGAPFAAFAAYTGGPASHHDRGPFALRGGATADYILGLSGNDAIHGEDAADLLSGGPGRDTLFGDAGDDVMDGGADNDRLLGGPDNDTMQGGDGDDFMKGQNGVDVVRGGPGDDTLQGNNGDDTVTGQQGDDVIKGGNNWDLVRGGAGNDTVDGQRGNDRVEGNAGNDRVLGKSGHDTLVGGTGDDVLLGDDGRDFLNGEDGADTLVGGTGRDTLMGGEGDDLLTGGAGPDLFRFKGDSLTGDDTVTDFENGTDLIKLDRGVAFDDLTIAQVGGDTVISWDNGSVTLHGETGVIDADDFLF